MTVRLSTGARNALAQAGGFAGAFNKCSIAIYTGTQPATADSAATGTLLGTVTLGSAALTSETQASQTITVAGSAGSINTVTVGTLNIIPDGAVAFRTDAATTALDLNDAINRNGLFTATVSGAVVTVKPRPGAGTTYNGVAFATTVTTLTATVGAATLSGGVAAVNALTFGAPAAGVVSKPTTATWSFNGVAAGTAGWFRVIGSVADAGAAISAALYLVRLDGSIATSGGDLNLSNITIAVSSPNTIDTFSFTIPSQ
jgi:hypothetical protein